MTRAYSSLYLDTVQDVLGHALDWVANMCNKSICEFCELFSRSIISAMFEMGYPRYVTGCNGAEIVNFIMEDNLPEYDFPHEFYADKSPEYWTGCTLAYFQWRQNLSFKTILQKIPVQKILGLYPLGHEQDVRNIADISSDML